MSDTHEEKENNNVVESNINDELKDEEILINDKNKENQNYQYYQNNILFNNGNDLYESSGEEDSDDTIVAFQEEKNSNLLDSHDNIFTKDSTNENEHNLEYEKDDNDDISDNKLIKLKSGEMNTNTNKIKISNKKGLKKKKKKKKKDKEEKSDKIEIYAHDKKKKHIKLNNSLKKIRLDNQPGKSTKAIEKSENILIKKKLSVPLNINQIKSKNLSKSIKQIHHKHTNSSGELTPNEIIYENGVTDDEEEIKKILKKRKKRKTNLKPILTPYLISIKEKNEYNLRLQKIRQQFTEKKFSHETKFFYYVLKPGNGSALVKNSLKHRVNWREAQMNVTSLYNFKWQAFTMCIDYNRLSSVESIPQMVNHFEYHSSISNKSNMFLNLFQYCESNNINIWKFVPLTIFLSRNNENEKCFDTLFDNINDYIIDYNDIKETLDKEKSNEKYSNLFKTVVCNLYGRRKDLPKDSWMMGSRTPLQISNTHYEGKNLWVLKASNLNRGQCIRLLDSKEKFHEIIKDWSQGINLKNINKGITDNNIQFRVNSESNPSKSEEIPMSDTFITERIIVQKYIEKPLCYYGRKCDMRVWVLLTQGFKVYVFKEGHLKTCSEKYDINNQKDAFVHITNYSFQKHSSNFQKFELGNEVPFYDFQKFLDKEYKNKKIDVRKDIMEKVKNIISISMKSVKDKINQKNRNYCFEIFGYDFMMDTDFNVYLLEINSNPGLEISSPWIKAIVPRMVDDALRLTLDEVFPTKYQFDKNIITELPYEEYSNDLVHNKEEDKNEGPRIIKRKRFTTICDQGSGTQDITQEEYQQENIRKKEVVIQKKINENKIEDIKNNENSAHKAQNEKECIKELLEKNYEENNGNNNNKNQNKTKEKEKEKEKPFNEKDYKTPFPVPGYEPWENLWELICDLNEEKTQFISNSNPNNYTTGIKGLLEIQKKRQTASAPIPNDNNTKRGNKNNNNINNNNQKDKNIANNNINNNNNNKNNNNNQKDKNIESNNNKNNNNQKEIKKDKKIDDKKTIKKPNENQAKKNINNKLNNLNKNKEKEKTKENKGNNFTKIKQASEERKNNEINKNKKIIKNNEIEQHNDNSDIKDLIQNTNEKENKENDLNINKEEIKKDIEQKEQILKEQKI